MGGQVACCQVMKASITVAFTIRSRAPRSNSSCTFISIATIRHVTKLRANRRCSHELATLSVKTLGSQSPPLSFPVSPCTLVPFVFHSPVLVEVDSEYTSW